MLTIGFDADDTLWHNESLFAGTQEKYRELLAPYHSAEWIDRKLYETETRNLAHFGYGIKGFALSMVETAIELTEGRITGSEIQQILDLAKAMLQAPVELLPGVADVIPTLAEMHSLLLITKGDLFDQESKIARSGLAEHFAKVEIVREKEPAVYAAILARYHIDPAHFLMVGNSVRSDILPVLAIGGRAAHIPYAITWQHEAAAAPETTTNGFYHLASIHDLPVLVEQLSAAG
jgi:putative hydrolase of the HAD superfamily